MTDGTAGWFRDPNDPALARWHDGDRWTEHTLVIADQAPGSEPPPPVDTPTAASPAFEATATYGAYGAATEGGSLANRARGLPTWAKVLAPLVVVAVIGLAFLLTSGDDDPSTTETADTESATLDDAVDAARRAGLDDAISDSRAAALIERICDAAEDPSEVDELAEDLAQLPAATTTDLRQQISALGEGAELRCEAALDDEPDLIDDLQDQAAVAFSTTTTAPTLLPDGSASTVPGEEGDGTTGGTGTGGGSKTTTTRRSGSGTTTPTTRPPTTTTVPVRGLGDSCSTEGAKAVTSSGKSLTCTRTSCFGTSTKLAYAYAPKNCQTTTTPPTNPGTNPSVPPNTSTTVEA